MAEHGDPSAGQTIEGDGDSLADEVDEHGSGGVQDQLEDIAQTGDDASDEVSFEQGGEEVVVIDDGGGAVGGGDESGDTVPDNTDQNQQPAESGMSLPGGTVELPGVGEVPAAGVALAVLMAGYAATGG